MLDYDNSYKTCDICGKEFIAKYRRYHCDHCDKYFYVCNTCVKKDKIPCRFCGVGLKKKRERLTKAN